MTDVKHLYREGDPDTSREAAESIDATKLEKAVLEVVALHGNAGATQDEVLAILSGLAYSSVTARFAALKRKGMTEVTGKRRGKSGRGQSVHVATAFGKATLK